MTGSAAPNAKTAAEIVTALAERLEAEVLPGETGFAPDELVSAARFLLGAARQREAGQPAIAIETVSEADRRLMRIALINDDMPFLVDSIGAALGAHGLTIDRLVHPVVPVSRSSAGRLKALGEAGQRESMIYLETSRLDAAGRRRLLAELRTTLAEVRAAVADWPDLRAAMREDAERLEAAARNSEGAALLRWFESGMLTQLGHVVRTRDGRLRRPRGICRAGKCELLAEARYERAFAWFDKRGRAARAPLIVKSNRISAVHRRVPVDLIIVPVMADGEVAALSVHAGIWTSAALNTPPDRVPRLRKQLGALIDKLGFETTGHAGKALVHAMTALPHDVLIGFSTRDLERVTAAMVSLGDRPRSKAVLVRAPLKRHLFAFVWLPRDAISTEMRLQVMALLRDATRAEVLDWSLEVEGGALALLRFVIDIREGGRLPDERELDRQLQALVRGWGEAVEAELLEAGHGGRAAALAARYAEAFPLSYRSAYGAAEAAADLERLHRLVGRNGGRVARIYNLPGDPADQVRLKLYQTGGPTALSDAVPALENFGFRVMEEVPTALDGAALGTIHDFRLITSAVGALSERAAAIEAAVARVIEGAAENDPFNRLIVAAALTPDEANGLRAAYRYLRQAGIGYGIATAVEALERAPDVTRALVDLFRARHQPRFTGDRAAAAARAQRAIDRGLAQVAAINEDRMLRSFRALIEAILRTNAFNPAGREALAYKIDSKLVPGLPKPVPWREIFVYSRRVEGVHLRAGPVARGGIRWSNRRDDYRTEVLGLMKAQRVKNAVIVPTGAKGGFFPKRLPDPAGDRDAWLAEGRESYQVFIRALLSVTDNLIEGRVVHPSGVVINDGDDPYFVVAADKGTASFSDTANAIAEDFGFWLDDAFASGGSKGYDHKEMGITARGAWISVQRHFLEMGTDVQTEPVKVAGCGDMSGDVFGNGMLLSKTIKLVGAFDHRHVFIDPDPDPARSWRERKRLFELPRSSWGDYDSRLISAGGGVWPRTQKAIPLSPQARELLGVEAETVDPDTLIRALLTSPVDLLWFGGIGTYLKSSDETHAEVGDPANDAVRADAAEVRARVIGEGANLACTQAGRIEYALVGAGGTGGRINTDFIDNSAGVDCSDHEVNIKIALAAAKRAGRLSEPARVKLLEAMTEDVAAQVLEDNRLQALALSLAQARGPQAVPAQARLIDTLEASGDLDRRTEGLAESSTLVRRAADGLGLTRPELAVLLSSTKLALQAAIEASALPDDPGLEGELLDYFPQAMRRRFKSEISAHRLRREILATRFANRLVNRLGIVNPFELAEEESVGLAEVAAAFLGVERLFGLEELWDEIERAQVGEGTRLLLLRRVGDAARGHMADLLRLEGATLQPTPLVKALGPAVAKLRAQAKGLLSEETHEQSLRHHDELVEAGAPQTLADRVTGLFDLAGAIGLAHLAGDTGLDPARLTQAYVALGHGLGLDWAQVAASRLTPTDPWERLLVAGLSRDLSQVRLEFLGRHLTGDCAPTAVVRDWLAEQADELKVFRMSLARAQAATAVTPAMLARIASQARAMLAR
jgi:glutamate dehydrogenase